MCLAQRGPHPAAPSVRPGWSQAGHLFLDIWRQFLSSRGLALGWAPGGSLHVRVRACDSRGWPQWRRTPSPVGWRGGWGWRPQAGCWKPCSPRRRFLPVWPVGCWVGGTHAAQAQPDPAGRGVDVGGLAKQKQCFKESAARRHFLSKRPRWASVRVARPDLRSEQLGIFRDGPSAGLSFSGHPHLSAHLSPPSWCGGLAPMVRAPALGRRGDVPQRVVCSSHVKPHALEA